ncbi:hypothetical protein TNCT_542371 [Trichonephila clavata]|uniref:Uncharacterized protein n=1 Tax=Trichonephila clavata TaxID=2740835 RepID=A0A8X6GYK0_TRICU|nr:hypothetical protein TNCT_542371 [Trichonephila clavata]
MTEVPSEDSYSLLETNRKITPDTTETSTDCITSTKKQHGAMRNGSVTPYESCLCLDENDIQSIFLEMAPNENIQNALIKCICTTKGTAKPFFLFFPKFFIQIVQVLLDFGSIIFP